VELGVLVYVLLLLDVVHVEGNERGSDRFLTVRVGVNGFFDEESESIFLNLMAQGL